MHQIFDFGWGCTLRPIPSWGSLQRSPDPLAVFKGPNSKGREGKGREGMKREGRDGKGREGKNLLPHLKQVVGAYESDYSK